MPPHAVSTRGPWFEGWYYRLYDPARQVSIVVIATSAYQDGAPVPGYLATLIQLPDESSPRTDEAYPTDHRVRRLSPPRVASGARDESFVWSTSEAELSESRVLIRQSALQLEIQAHERRAWPDWLGLGPWGLLNLIPGLPLYWHVDNTGGRASYRLTDHRGDLPVVIEGEGFLHQEKNWGEVFPKAWMWLQGLSSDGEASLAVAGGLLDLRLINVNSFVVGFRKGRDAYLFSPPSDPSTQFQFRSNSCAGEFELEATNRDYRMTLKAIAPPDSFSYVSIPTDSGYQANGGIESFRAKIRVDVYRNDFFSRRRLESFTFDNAALEFGAAYMLACAPQ